MIWNENLNCSEWTFTFQITHEKKKTFAIVITEG